MAETYGVGRSRYDRDRLPSLPSMIPALDTEKEAVLDTVGVLKNLQQKLGGDINSVLVTAGDVASRSNVSLNRAKQVLIQIAMEAKAILQPNCTDSGVGFQFPLEYRKNIKALEKRQKYKWLRSKLAAYALCFLRASFAIMIVFSVLLFFVVLIVILIAILSQKQGKGGKGLGVIGGGGGSGGGGGGGAATRRLGLAGRDGARGAGGALLPHNHGAAAAATGVAHPAGPVYYGGPQINFWELYWMMRIAEGPRRHHYYYGHREENGRRPVNNFRSPDETETAGACGSSSSSAPPSSSMPGGEGTDHNYPRGYFPGSGHGGGGGGGGSDDDGDDHDGVASQANDGFFAMVYSFLFGDEDPNCDRDRVMWQSIAAFIQREGGVVIAEDLAPFLDEYIFKRSGQLSHSQEQYVLPVLHHLGGVPESSDDGMLVYVFPHLQSDGETAFLGYDPHSQNAPILERRWEFTRFKFEQWRWALFLGVFNMLEIFLFYLFRHKELIDDSLLRNKDAWVVDPETFMRVMGVLYPPLLWYGLAYLLIPFVRWLALEYYVNPAILRRNKLRARVARELREVSLGVPPREVEDGTGGKVDPESGGSAEVRRLELEAKREFGRRLAEVSTEKDGLEMNAAPLSPSSSSSSPSSSRSASSSSSPLSSSLETSPRGKRALIDV